MRNGRNIQPCEDPLDYEERMLDGLRCAIFSNAEFIDYCWRYGDGEGAIVYYEMVRILRELGFCTPSKEYDRHHGIQDPSTKYKKKRIPGNIRTQVYERDMYRCKECGTHKALTVDHIYPESLGGESSLENLQTLCKSCNSRKGITVPNERSREGA